MTRDVTLRNKATGRKVAHKTVQENAALEPFLADFDVLDGTLELDQAPMSVEASMEWVRNERNRLRNLYAWTVQSDTPLTTQSRQQWLQYLKALNAVTKDLTDPTKVVWPQPPAGFDYA